MFSGNNFKGGNLVDIETIDCPSISYDIYRVVDNKNRKKNSEGIYEVVEIESNKEGVIERIRKITKSMKKQVEEQKGGASFKFNITEDNNKEDITFDLTDDSNPLEVLEILKELGVKACKDKNGRVCIQSFDSWEEKCPLEIPESEEGKTNFNNLLKLVRASIDFINRNPGVLNPETTQEKNEDEKTEEVVVVAEGEEVGDNTTGGFMSYFYSNMFGGFNLGVEELSNLVDLTQNKNKNGLLIGGGKSKFFITNVNERFNKLNEKVNGSVDNTNFQNLKNTSLSIEKEEEKLNKDFNKMIGGKSINKEEFINRYNLYRKNILSLNYGCDKLQEMFN